jgi:hypothetical protein
MARKVTFYAELSYPNKQTFDVVDDFDLDEGEWDEMSEEERYFMVSEWANERLDSWYEEEGDED